MSFAVVDLFSGAGGLTEGFAKQGFEILAHIEKDSWACETLRTRICYHWLRKVKDLDTYHSYLMQVVDTADNHNLRKQLILDNNKELENLLEDRVFNQALAASSNNASEITPAQAIAQIETIAKKNGIQEIPVVIGGPPCQAYSLIGRGRMKDFAFKDDRNYLFEYYLDIVKGIQPKIFVFENVPGIFTAKNGKIFPEIKKRFEDIGYGIVSGPYEKDSQNIIDACQMGIYQTRRRVILFGYLKSKFPDGFEYPDLTSYADIPAEVLSTSNTILDLPPLYAGEGKDFWYKKYDATAFSEYQKLMREDCPGVVNHMARRHRLEDLEIYKLQIEASNAGKPIMYSGLPERLQFHKNRDKKVFEDRFRVHGIDEIPHTIVAHIAKDGHYNIHPDVKQLRSLTVREAARIQSFPDNYIFEGPRTSQFMQVGNAVPPRLSEIIAKAVAEILAE